VDLSSPANTFTGVVTVAADDVTLAATGSLTSTVVAGGNAQIAADGDVTLLGNISADSLSIQSTSGSITQDSNSTIAISTGTATFDAVDRVTLSGTGNDFGTAGLQIGNPNSVANVTIDSDINILGPINVFGRDITLGAVLTAGVNSNIVVSATHNFFNLQGSDALNVSGTGRWVVYAGSARDNNYGGLDSGNTAVWNASIGTSPINLIPAGNRYVFNQDPIRTVVLRTTDSSKVYGDAFNVSNSYAITATGITEVVGAYRGVNETTSVTLGDVFTANPVFTSDKATATAVVGTSAINITPGSHRASTYNITYQNTGVLTVTPRAITLAANSDSKVYGDQNPATYSASIVSGSVATAIGDTLDNVTGTFVRESGENAGQYDVLLGAGNKASNYAISFETNNNAFIIHRANLSATGERQYTGNTTWSGSDLTIVGVNGETFTATGSGLLASKHVQSAQPLASVEGLVLAGVGVANTNNYQPLAVNQTSVSVTPKQLNLLAPDATKTYDANDLYEVTSSDLAGLSAQLLGGDLVTRAEVMFDDKDAGSNKTVQINSFDIDDGNLGNNYTIALINSTDGLINQAPLRITAVNDADFVTLADSRASELQRWDNYAGVIYTGLVGGETPSVLNRGTVTRSNLSDLSAQTYRDVLAPSGFSSNNYNITYESGDYTIVAANTLLVRVSPTSTVYGTAPTYDLTAQYLASDESTIRSLVPAYSDRFTVDDGAGSVVRFDVAAENPAFSSSNQLIAGGYNLNQSDLQVSSVSDGNFNNMVLVGSLSVTPKILNSDLGVDRIEKVYDGTNSIAELNLNFDKATASVLVADQVNLFGGGTFGDRHVGVAKAVNISLALRGADAANYALTSNSFTDPVGVITQLNSVQWIGTDGANWSNASNWAGGALPDESNVANILIPTAAVSVYDSDAFGSSTSFINNQGVIRFTSNNEFVFSNNVSGAGGIEQRGSGLLNVSGFNTHTGDLDIGGGAVVLGHTHALGQGGVISSGGSLSLDPDVVLSSLRVTGDITTTSAIRTSGDQIYNGALTFLSSGITTPVDDENDPPRLANFDSELGDIAFMGVVGAGVDAKVERRSLVVNAENGRVTFNDQVGLSAMDPLANGNTYLPAEYASFSQLENNSPWAVDVLGQTIAISANITSSQTQLYTGSVLVGNNGNNGFTRLLLSLDPAITFNGAIDDTINGRHSLVLRAISTDPSEVPSIQVGNVGQTTPLAGFDLLTGQQAPESLVTHISMDRTTFVGDVLLNGSVKTMGNQTYVGRSIRFDDTGSPIVLDTDAGTIEILPGLNSSNDPNVPAQTVEVQGLNAVRFALGVNAPGLGQNLQAYAQEQGLSLSVARRLPPAVPAIRQDTGQTLINPGPLIQTATRQSPRQDTGQTLINPGSLIQTATRQSPFTQQPPSSLTDVFKRSFEQNQRQALDVEEWLDTSGLMAVSGQVAVGDLEDAPLKPSETNDSTSSPGCSESTASAQLDEQCQTNTQN